MPEIIGLSKTIEDPGTGASSQFHALSAYLVMRYPPSCSVTMAGWISRAAYDAGKKPLTNVSVRLDTAPTGDVSGIPAWACERILAAPTNALSGAELVYAAEALAEEPSA
ncbi:hypothetical protein BH10PSE18_BH10PSE18_19150 [soil metagenome]